MGSVLITLASYSPRAIEPAAGRNPPEALVRKAGLCGLVLKEARRHFTARKFGPILGQLLARACDLLDETDEVLVGLDPGRGHAAFERVAALHRDLEEIQSLVPRRYRSLARGSWLG